MFAFLFKTLAFAAAMMFFYYIWFLHAPEREEGTTGQLMDEFQRRIPLYSFTFLAGEDWGPGIAVPDADSLVACIRYDTALSGSGHILAVFEQAEEIQIQVSRSSGVEMLSKGDEYLLENGDQIGVIGPGFQHNYTYARKTIYPERKEQAEWLDSATVS